MTYDPTLPTPRDRMRFTLGDIVEPPLRGDDTYDALLLQFDEPTATMKMAESLASEYAQNPSSVSVGGVSVSYATLVSTWRAIADQLRRDLASGAATGGGFSSGTLDRFGNGTDAEYRRTMDDVYGDDWQGNVW